MTGMPQQTGPDAAAHASAAAHNGVHAPRTTAQDGPGRSSLGHMEGDAGVVHASAMHANAEPALSLFKAHPLLRHVSSVSARTSGLGSNTSIPAMPSDGMGIKSPPAAGAATAAALLAASGAGKEGAWRPSAEPMQMQMPAICTARQPMRASELLASVMGPTGCTAASSNAVTSMQMSGAPGLPGLAHIMETPGGAHTSRNSGTSSVPQRGEDAGKSIEVGPVPHGDASACKPLPSAAVQAVTIEPYAADFLHADASGTGQGPDDGANANGAGSMATSGLIDATFTLSGLSGMGGSGIGGRMSPLQSVLLGALYGTTRLSSLSRQGSFRVVQVSTVCAKRCMTHMMMYDFVGTPIPWVWLGWPGSVFDMDPS